MDTDTIVIMAALGAPLIVISVVGRITCAISTRRFRRILHGRQRHGGVVTWIWWALSHVCRIGSVVFVIATFFGGWWGVDIDNLFPTSGGLLWQLASEGSTDVIAYSLGTALADEFHKEYEARRGRLTPATA
ncbi:hypothetical protein [Kitasatospora griseola]|uniref:hypothetical protein n=1 Tax=Kitasatospora griseola TaxID=2064 RepID=UPI0016712060|nr:hypothetical protein [Kitasatospora griseola]GGR00663.1 hypothetical protein GCM10010195_65580 [Kitasatospora griseola]